MNQPTPKVIRTDVERIVRRDFSAEQFEKVMAILDEYGKEKFHNEIDRVQLAVLKLAKRNMDLLRRHINVAVCDYRDVLAPAEYPEYSRNLNSFKLPDEEKQQLYSRDWNQYESWISSK